MTFRPSQIARWTWVLLISIAVAVGYGALWLDLNSRRHRISSIEGTLAIFALVGTLVWFSLGTWRARVIVDDRGLSWKGGQEPADFMTWDQIARLDYDRKARPVIVGVIEKVSGRFYPLPFMSKELYSVLKEHLNPLPEDVEKVLLVSL